MGDSWPSGVTTQDDMHRYAKTLFGNCKTENLLTGTEFDGRPGCLLTRVKDAGNQGNWEDLPELIDWAMQDTVKIYERPDVIQAKSKVAGAPRRRLYDTLQVTPNPCNCRVYFGGDGHHKLQTGSLVTPSSCPGSST